jgi:hypothetical protein
MKTSSLTEIQGDRGGSLGAPHPLGRRMIAGYPAAITPAGEEYPLPFRSP